MTATLAEELVTLLTAVDSNQLPASTDAAVRRNSLQIFGVAPLGLQNPVARDAVRYVSRYESGSDATVVAHGVKSGTVTGAAFANSLASHADFREDTHAESSSHPGVVVMPSILAAAELLDGPLGPGRYAEAVVAGHEMIGRLGAAALAETIERGFRTPSVYTLFGGTIAAGMVLGLSPEEHVNAIAIAAQGASGVNHPFYAGTDEWFVAPALATRHAVSSALLAREGLRGSAAVLEGTQGVLDAFAGAAVKVDTSPLGERQYEVERARLKAALTCGWNQSLVHQLRTLSPGAESVKTVAIRMSPVAAEYPGVAKQGGFTNRSEALLSAPFASALQLVRGSLDHSGYDSLDDETLLDVASRVTVSTDQELEGYATAIDVGLVSGEVLRSADGNDAPAFSLSTADQVLDTLRRNYASAGYSPDAVDVLDTAVMALIDAGDVTALAEALGADPS